jgi:hypothetical protein
MKDIKLPPSGVDRRAKVGELCATAFKGAKFSGLDRFVRAITNEMSFQW